MKRRDISQDRGLISRRQVLSQSGIALGLGATGLGATGLGLTAGPAHAVFGNDAVDAQALVDRSKASVSVFAADSQMAWVRNNLSRARALMIIPESVRGGFIIGGSGGSGVLLARGDWLQGWSYPAFYAMGSVTFGLQIGGQISEIILMVMTDNGLDHLLTTNFTLGAEVSVAAGPVGAGASAQTADILAFARTKGLYGGLNIEGAAIRIRNRYNEVYYNQPGVRPRDILLTRTVSNPQANDLRRAVGALGRSATEEL